MQWLDRPLLQLIPNIKAASEVASLVYGYLSGQYVAHHRVSQNVTPGTVAGGKQIPPVSLRSRVGMTRPLEPDFLPPQAFAGEGARATFRSKTRLHSPLLQLQQRLFAFA